MTIKLSDSAKVQLKVALFETCKPDTIDNIRKSIAYRLIEKLSTFKNVISVDYTEIQLMYSSIDLYRQFFEGNEIFIEIMPQFDKIKAFSDKKTVQLNAFFAKELY